ncbi:hypothetical protein fugu_013084 [Takifugu bimaculatus]|uniref:Uncharacterized protein n=1 Tax=Takifugu bimaculatus TaxID=433685 RepID=A0A4Z2C769_9TELE|nr:hypothetical protein fugu_013084 [Takifugu bimaculatus]
MDQELTEEELQDLKVFSKLSLHVPEKTVRKIVLNTAGAIEPALHVLKEKLQKKLEHDGDHTTILQMKVNRLEHLVHLKDMRIQDLTQHLETYKTKGKA